MYKRQIFELGGATYGEKTMVDALYPAMRAVAELDAEASVAEALQAARAAAVDGVRETRAQAAKKGRASYLGESTKDVPDPGAIVVCWLFGDTTDVSNF